MNDRISGLEGRGDRDEVDVDLLDQAGLKAQLEVLSESYIHNMYDAEVALKIALVYQAMNEPVLAAPFLVWAEELKTRAHKEEFDRLNNAEVSSMMRTSLVVDAMTDTRLHSIKKIHEANISASYIAHCNDPSDFGLLFDYAKVLFQAGEWKEALRAFLELNKSQEHEVVAVLFQARCYEQQSQSDKAIPILSKLLVQLDASTWNDLKKRCYYQLSNAYKNSPGHDNSLGEALMDQVYQVDPDYVWDGDLL